MPITKKRLSKRTSENGFDLDLTYIKPNIIVIGYPYENFEGLFKSHGMDKVVRFLDLRHLNYYRVYNLCSERSYDSSKFHMRAITYPFDANCPPPFELIQQFCEDVSAFLKADDRNVAVVHCCNGVQRTGVMVCSYLLHDQIFYSTKDALQFFAAARTHDGVGVIIPSQRRYVQYYGYMIKNNIMYSSNAVYLQSLKFIGTPCMQGSSCSPYFTISVQKETVYASKVYDRIKISDCITEFLLPQQLLLFGDVSIKFFHHTRFGGKENMFKFCFNACFVDMHLLLQQHRQTRAATPNVRRRSLSTGCLSIDSDDSNTQMGNRAQSNSPLLTVPSQPFQSSEIRKFASLTDIHAAASITLPITYEQRSSSGSILSSSNYQSSCKPRVQRASSNFLYKKMLPQDKQLRRALKKAGKYAGIDITTGFTTVVQKPAKHDRIPQKIPQDATYNPNLTLSPLAVSRRRSNTDVIITSNPTSAPVDAVSVIVGRNSSVEESSDSHKLVTIVAPLSELDHAAKHIPDDFQLHIVLSVDPGLIKDIEDNEYFHSDVFQGDAVTLKN